MTWALEDESEFARREKGEAFPSKKTSPKSGQQEKPTVKILQMCHQTVFVKFMSIPYRYQPGITERA